MLRPAHIKKNALNQKKKPSALIVVDRTHLCTEEISLSENALVEATRKQDIKHSAVVKRQLKILQPNSIVSPIKCSSFEVLNTIQSIFNKMSYNEIINIVSTSANRIFGVKKGQEVHESIKIASNMFTNVPMHQISTNSHQFNQHVKK